MKVTLNHSNNLSKDNPNNSFMGFKDFIYLCFIYYYYSHLKSYHHVTD